MKDLIVIAAILVLLWFFFMRENYHEGVPCPVYDIDTYRRTQQQPVP
jgi:hypothetical protein